jgi:cytosine/adenosine deaminase-related metal-dependent hydrolase
MLLQRVNIIGKNDLSDISINHAVIKNIYPTDEKKSECRFSILFDNAIAFPGLINSHDHLDFNSFPQLSNKIYTNYREWGKDIHTNNKDEINGVLKIPQHLRVMWGMYKNLLNGFTAVVNHGEPLKVVNEFITVYQNCHCLHSPGFEKNWKWKLNQPLAKRGPIAMHIGEGTDELAHEEISDVVRFNIFKKEIIGIHGVAMDEAQAAFFKGLVWCPDSNYFLLDKTCDVGRLNEKTNVVFGTDSTLTSSWNIWEQIRLARKRTRLTAQDIFQMLTLKPAMLWGFKDKGKLEENFKANIVVARRREFANDMEAFFSVNPEDILLIIHDGHIRFFDVELLHQMTIPLSSFSRIEMNGQQKYVFGKLPSLLKSIRRYYPQADFGNVSIPSVAYQI